MLKHCIADITIAITIMIISVIITIITIAITITKFHWNVPLNINDDF